MVCMGVTIRIDVDTPYGWQSLGAKARNYLRLNWWFPAVTKLGYLHSLNILLNDLMARNIPAAFFFTKFTTPTNMEKYTKYFVGAHLISARNYNEFQKEIDQISNGLNRKICGFTKHGSGKLKLCRTHAPQYEQNKYVDWAQKAKLLYFIGNGENPDEMPFYIGTVKVYPSVFWINRYYRDQKYSIEWLAEESTDRDIIVLIHPYYWLTKNQVRKEYEKMIDKIDNFKLIN
jgi:hypothetical protein